MREKRCQRIDRGRLDVALAGFEAARAFLRVECGRGVDELIQVLDPVGAFALVSVMLLQPAALDDDLDLLGERQASRLGAQRLDQGTERSERLARPASERAERAP